MACSFDGGAFAPCSSPQTFNNLALGQHTFKVQATDPNGATESPAASRTFTVVNPPLLVAGPPPFAGITLAGLKTISIDAKGNGTINIPCPASAQGPCAGTGAFNSASKIVLREAAKKKKAKKKIQKLSSFSFAGIQPGTTKKVKFKLSSKALKLLLKNGTLTSKLTITSHDNRNVSKASSTTVTLKAKKKKKKH
jgi:hypothetical protein